MDLQLKGKVALITGGSKGIGRAAAKILVDEGAKVAIIARNQSGLADTARWIYEQTGQEILTLSGDVTLESDCQHAVEQTVQHYGQLNILINNAGTAAAQPFPAIEPHQWQADLDLKLLAAIHCSRAAIPHMKRVGGGAIVNVTAIGGKTPGASSMPSSVSRAAGLALTKAMSKDLAPAQIRVNTVCIGGIRSEQIERMWQQTAPELTWEQYATLPSHNIPLGRIGNSEEAARVIMFLVSGAASYVTGTSVNIDGGKAEVL
jgi:3-oxoacyl-[acyl-carrier protein] reductase